MASAKVGASSETVDEQAILVGKLRGSATIALPAEEVTLPAPALDPHSSDDFLHGGVQAALGNLRAELTRVRDELAVAEREAAAWNAIDGTPRVHDATKNRHVKPHLVHWQARVSELKVRARELETDIASLGVIAGA